MLKNGRCSLGELRIVREDRAAAVVVQTLFASQSSSPSWSGSSPLNPKPSPSWSGSSPSAPDEEHLEPESPESLQRRIPTRRLTQQLN